jgi:hypothetical protein
MHWIHSYDEKFTYNSATTNILENGHTESQACFIIRGNEDHRICLADILVTYSNREEISPILHV